MSDEQEERYGPQFEVWNHLWSAIDQAKDELRALDAESRKFVEEIGGLIAKGRTDFVLQHGDARANLLKIEETLLADVWLRHAAEIEIARLGIRRSDHALTRFLKLRPVITAKAIPERAKRYIREVIDTFVFGFDAACIALCRAACEQVLRDELVKRGVYTEPQLRRERPTAGALIANAKRAGLLKASSSAVERLVSKGDTVMHSFIFDERVLEQQALDSIGELARVLAETLA
jgi:hypothetical protein